MQSADDLQEADLFEKQTQEIEQSYRTKFYVRFYGQACSVFLPARVSGLLTLLDLYVQVESLSLAASALSASGSLGCCSVYREV